MKVQPLHNPDENKVVAYEFKCAGCGHAHVFYTEPFADQPVWSFNGDVNNPTFTPSLLNTWPAPSTKRCHLFLTNGQVQFLSDCSHYLAGQTVELSDIKK